MPTSRRSPTEPGALRRGAAALLGEDQNRAVEQAMEILGTFQERYEHYWLRGMRRNSG